VDALPMSHGGYTYFGFLGSIWQHTHIHVLADFFQDFWRIFFKDPIPNIVTHNY
jgi:hypothetical protein